MAKYLVFDQESCTGCRLCEMVCSLKKEGVVDPSRARLRIIKWEWEGFYFPIACQHCKEPLCATVCPVNAIQKDKSLDRVVVNLELCIGCRACVAACPMGAVGYDSKGGKVFRCDLCDGDPTCIKYCNTKAIQYVEMERVQLRKMRSTGEELYRALKKT